MLYMVRSRVVRRKSYRKRTVNKPLPYTGRRRLQGKVAAASGVADTVFKVIKHGTRLYSAGKKAYNYWNKNKTVSFKKASHLKTVRLQQSDNITNLQSFKYGTPRQIGFNEKVDRIAHPPVIFKRQYAWSSECTSGRKGWMQIPLNKLTTSGLLYGDLYEDAINSVNRLTTDTSNVDPTLLTSSQATIGKVYIDYLSEKLRMVNSGTNSLNVTLSLYGYKRDCDSYFANVNVPMTPINLMMLASTNNLSNYSPLGYDQTVGNGWEFDTTTSGVNMIANYDMPGSSVNTGGASAQTDPSLKVLSSHINELTGYYLKELNSIDFSLKPGQEVNHYTIFNDMANIVRNNQDMTYLKGISHYLVISFQAGIVGDAIANNVVSTGSGQLSCILEEKRIIGTRGRNNNGKIFMATPPLAGILNANQFTINPDSGVADTGYEEDA